jgi:hypothetical protein
MRVALSGVAAFLMLAVTSGAASAQTSTQKSPSTVNPSIPRLNDVTGVGDPSLVNDLRKGGYVIFFRHASTDWSQRDTDYSNFDNRDGQRNLSDAGKADAGTIGKAFQALEVPVDSVFVSPMFRCRDTAQFAFGRYEIRMALFGKVPVAADGLTKAAEDRAQYRSERIHMLSKAPAKGMNRVLVGQQDPMLPIISGLHRDELREGDALIIRPMGGDKFKVVAQVTVADWTRLAAAYAGKKPAK